MEKVQLHLYEWKDNKFSQIAIIDDYQEYSFEHNLFSAGQFTVTINFNIPNAHKFKRGLFIKFGENDYDFGEISRVTDTLGENGKGSQIRQIFGCDARYLLKRRVIKNMNDGGKWSMTAKGELCLRNLVNDQCGSNAEEKRRLPVVNTIPLDADAIGKEYSVSEEFSDLYEVCKTIATQSEIGWRMKFNTDNLILECYSGEDLHNSVFFSPDFDSLASGNFSDSTDAFSNTIYVAGKGQNENRDLYEGETVENEQTPTGLDRFESFDNQSEMTTEEEYEAEAFSMLSQYGQTIEMNGQGLVKCPYVFREQYNIGDKITLSFNEQKAIVQILSVTERSAKGNYSLSFQFGKPQNTLTEQLQIMLRKLQRASNKTNAVDSVKWYEIPTDPAMSKSDVTFNTIGFTGAIGNSDFTFTLYNDDEQTGSKTYNVYFKNLTGSGKLVLTTGKADTDVLEMKSGTYIASVYVDEEGNVKLNSQTVAVNPEGEATETAQTLEVGGTIYNVGGGSGGGIPVGSIIAMYSENPPSDNWLLCDGSTFDPDEYPALYMYLGTNVLPDLRNKAIMGANPDVVGKADGNTSNLGDVQKAQLPNIKGIINAQPSGTNETLANHTSDGAFIPDFTRQRSIDSGTSSSSAYRCWKNFDASLNGEQDYPNNVKVNHFASKDHLGDNVYYGNFDCQTGEVTTAGETRPANIRLNYFIKAVTSSSDSDYQSTLQQIMQFVEHNTVPSVFNTQNVDVTKTITIPDFTVVDKAKIEVVFVNGHYVANNTDAFTLNVNSDGAKKVYCVKNGQKTEMKNHSCTRAESGDNLPHYWYLQSNTKLTLYYDALLDGGNGGWVIMDNPIVLEYMTTGHRYQISADGWHKEWFSVTASSNSVQTITFSIPYNDPPYLVGSAHRNSSDSTEYYRYGYDITTSDFKYQGIANSMWHFIAEGY